jgi:hypothetical protein
MGHLIGAVVVSGAVGAFLPNAQFALIMVLVFVAAAAVSSFICQHWPGLEAPAWKLWLTAVFANPVMLSALGAMAVDWDCVVGLRRGWNCLAAAIAIVVAGGCLLPSLFGLAWRAWKRRGAPKA